MQIRSSDNLRRYNNLLGGINSAYHEAAAMLGLSDSAMQIMYTLCNYEGSCTIRDICELSALSKQTVNSALRKLEHNELIVLEAVSAKAKRVVLTQKGSAFAEATGGRLIDIENRIYASWSSDELERFLKFNQDFLCALKAEIKKIKDK